MAVANRTDAEIIARIEAVKEQGWMGTQTGDLVSALGWDAAKPFLKDDARPEDWAEKRPVPSEEIAAYMPFAWGKANDCRGLSAGRSIGHMRAWLWLDGKDELCARMDNLYDFYGKPCLAVICNEYGIDWRGLDDGEWRNDESGDFLTAEQALKDKGVWNELA